MPREPAIHPALKTAAVLAALLIATTILYQARAVLIPIALALLLTFLLAPLVRRFERLKLPRVASAFLAVGLATMFVAGLGWLVQGQLFDLADHLPEYKSNLRHKLDQLRPASGVLDKARSAISELSTPPLGPTPEPAPSDPTEPTPAPPSAPPAATGATGPTGQHATPEPVPVRIVPDPTSAFVYATDFLGTVLHPAATAAIVLLFSIFMLVKREDMRNRFIRLLGPREMHIITPALDDAAQRVSRYLVAQSFTNAVAGLTIAIGFYFLHIPGALVWGLLIFLLRFVPYVGLWVAVALPIAISVSASSDWTNPLLAVGLVGIVELIIANAIEPLLFGSRVGVSPLAILATSVFWAWLWGPVGLVLATPLTVCLAVIGRHVPTLNFLDVILGDEPVLSPSTRLYQRLLSGDPEEAGEIVSTFSKDKSLAEVFDSLILPAVRVGEVTRRRGPSDPERDNAVTELFFLTIEDLLNRFPPSTPDPTVRPEQQTLCLAARDSADQLVAHMLVRLLAHQGISAQEVPFETLTGEVLQSIKTTSPAAICISAVPPGSFVHARVICKRVRSRFPDLPIVVGFWDAEANVQVIADRLAVDGPLHIVTTLQAAADQVRTLARLAP